MSMNVGRVEVTLGVDSNAPLLMGMRNSRANWQRLQYQVKHRAVISKKWLTVIDEAVHHLQAKGKKYNGRLAVKTVSATNSKTCAARNHCVSAFKFAARSAPTSDQPNQKGQTVSFGEDLLIKVPGFFKQLPLNPVALARLLLIFSIPFSRIQILEDIFEEDSPEEAIPEIIFIIIYVFLIVQQVEGTNHLGPHLRQDGMKIASTNKQVLSVCFIFLLSLSGAHAGDSTDGSNPSRRKEVEKHDSFNLKTASLTLAVIAIGVAISWIMLRRPARVPEFEVDDGLRNSPIPRINNPVFVIHPAL